MPYGDEALFFIGAASRLVCLYDRVPENGGIDIERLSLAFER